MDDDLRFVKSSASIWALHFHGVRLRQLPKSLLQSFQRPFAANPKAPKPPSLGIPRK